MNLQVMGLSYRTTSLSLREKLSFPADKICAALVSLNKSDFVEESIILSTCSRVEIYAMVSNAALGSSSIKEFICNFHRVNENKINDCLYQFNDTEAARHLFRVAASLDSMIVGESQILGQVKEAYFKALECGTVGDNLASLFTEAIRLAKSIRHQTQIGKGAISTSSVAVELLKKTLGDLGRKKALIIGAGKIGEITAKCLYSEGVEAVVVISRRFNKAAKLARLFRGKAVEFEKFFDRAFDMDIIISCTSASRFMLRQEQIKKIIFKRKNRPLFLIDLGVPRNIEARVGRLENVFLYNVDDLLKVRDAHIKERASEAKKAEQIIEQHIVTHCLSQITRWRLNERLAYK